jgi:drug/metabolite transporter (DMT)-like permease
MKTAGTNTATATLLGVFSILFWGSTVALSRSLSEHLGPVTTASYVFLLGGACSLAHSLFVARRRVGGLSHWAGDLKLLSLRYWLVCGGLFVCNQIAFYLAVGLAAGRMEAIEVGLINYLWPSLTILFSIPLLHKKGKATLLPGILIAGTGVALAMLPRDLGLFTLSIRSLSTNLAPCLLAFLAAITWGIYSNLSRALAASADGNAIPLFLLATGMVMAVLRLFFPEQASWTTGTVIELGATALFPAWLAFQFWDVAMRRGRLILVASLSYFTPLISVVISSVFLRVAPGPKLWIGCAMVIAGAVICNYSMKGET